MHASGDMGNNSIGDNNGRGVGDMGNVNVANNLKISVDKDKESVGKLFGTGTQKTTHAKGRGFNGSNHPMGVSNGRSAVNDMDNANFGGDNHQMGVSNGRSAVNDMSNVNASPKYHTITNADLEAINDLDKGLVR